ncbi:MULTISPECIES: hypothetical protein [Flagellimonas]|uniref:Uncharacterized protein n=2 Tax=Flagellimonas TaxID=444459 RepID=A0A1M6Y2N7_9FLAO|nr:MULTISPECIES: hypothetical protein [Allomuricauda]NDV42363.1 hypothetical protein [Allomuricauda sediminis]SFC04967.1 hypothetical protein SAMN04487891_10596 [Allomuricauda taeanensis]SHL12446.1 hypothetical protein SAMN05216293_2698 [Allomuricauda taeanensis]
MKTKILFMAFVILIVGQAMAQHGDKDWKHRKELHKKEIERQREYDKKTAEHRREMWKREREHYRELAKEEREYHKELRKRELEHLRECHACDHGFYHNDGYYYEEEVYYSRRTGAPVSVDAEFMFRNGLVRVRL